MNRKPAVASISIILAIAIAAPLIAPYDPAAQLDIAGLRNAAPSAAHWLGTDSYSRDVLSRAMHGARTSLLIAVVATCVATILGSVWGGIAAGLGGRLGAAMMLLVDVVRSVPRLLLFLAVVALLGALSPWILAVLLGIAAWPSMSRLTYSLVNDAESKPFVEAARSSGASNARVFAKHVVPHLTGPLLASGTLLIADVLALESGLSFIGLGIRPPRASWGNMVQDALPYLSSAWWTAAVPCVLLVVTVLSASSIADHLQKSTRRDETGVPAL
jgi:peptide/nickel transport system permease protein